MSLPPSSQSFDPEGFLNLARQLGGQSDEASLRTAVGRAYYAVFLIAKARLLVGDAPNVHALVIEKIRARNNTHLWVKQLGTLRELRKTADYEPLPLNQSLRNWQHNCRKALGLAEHLLDKVRAL